MSPSTLLYIVRTAWFTPGTHATWISEFCRITSNFDSKSFEIEDREAVVFSSAGPHRAHSMVHNWYARNLASPRGNAEIHYPLEARYTTHSRAHATCHCPSGEVTWQHTEMRIITPSTPASSSNRFWPMELSSWRRSISSKKGSARSANVSKQTSQASRLRRRSSRPRRSGPKPKPILHDGSTVLNTCVVFDCATGVWSTMAPMPYARYFSRHWRYLQVEGNTHRSPLHDYLDCE